MRRIRVLLVDDQRAVRDALRMMLTAHPDISVIGEAADGSSAVTTGLALQPDVVVMDYEMPGMNGVQATEQLRATGGLTAVVMLSLQDDAALREAAAKAGAYAFIGKHQPSTTLLDAIRSAASSVTGEEDTS